MKFLFVEDEVELLELYDMFLSDMEVDYLLAKDGQEAMSLLENSQFDYIFSDVRMPIMDGFQLLENVQKSKYKFKSFVFITANVDISKADALSKGATDILYKPLAHKKLKEYIQDLLK